MAGKASYLEKKQLLNVFQNQGYTAPTSVYVGLHTADPGDTGASEVTGGSYARVACTAGTAGTGAGAIFGGTSGSAGSAPTTAAGTQSTEKAQVVNTSAVVFPNPTANWGTVTYFSIWDAVTGGNLLYSGALTTSRTVNNGDIAPQFAAGQLVVFED